MSPPAASRSQRIFTAINQKGGVGKTTIACHLAFAAREAGSRVLLVDLDTQGSASTILTRDITIPQQRGGAQLLFNQAPSAEPLATPSGIDLLHGHQYLDQVDHEFDTDAAPAVRDALRTLPYDVVVIDTPPAVGTRHISPLFWSDFALTPLEPTSASIQGLAQTTDTLNLVRTLNPMIGNRVIINRHIRRSKSQRRNLERLAELVTLTEPFLTLRVAVGDALDAGVPVWRFVRAPADLRAAWRTLCGELLS